VRVASDHTQNTQSSDWPKRRCTLWRNGSSHVFVGHLTSFQAFCWCVKWPLNSWNFNVVYGNNLWLSSRYGAHGDPKAFSFLYASFFFIYAWHTWYAALFALSIIYAMYSQTCPNRTLIKPNTCWNRTISMVPNFSLLFCVKKAWTNRDLSKPNTERLFGPILLFSL